MTALHIDGSQGEGGGQILRTSLGLAALTGQHIIIENIRAGRRKSGLRNQHLTAVRAAARVSNGMLRGDELGANRLEFIPGIAQPGKYRFDIGTAGSAVLVLQTILPALLCQPERSKIVIEGGTHNPMAPSVDFLQATFLPLLAKMGARVDIKLIRPGFFPAGGGKIEVVIHPAESLEPLVLTERGKPVRQGGRVLLAHLPEDIAKREKIHLAKSMGWNLGWTKVFELPESRGPGNVVIADIISENIHEVFTAYGQKGLHAHKVVDGLVRETRAYLNSEAPVGPHLADQLLIPMALAKGGCIRVTELTEHTRTNMDVVQKFLPVRFDVKQLRDADHEITATDVL